MKRSAPKKMSPWIKKWHDDAYTRLVDRWCVCCGKPYGTKWSLSAHHRLPQAQGGQDKPSNGCAVCWDCHEKYHLRCNQSLAARVEDRVRNFAMWMQDQGTSDIFGGGRGAPERMAPDWVQKEYADWFATSEYRSLKP